MVPFKSILLNRTQIIKVYPALLTRILRRYKSTDKYGLTASSKYASGEIDTNVKPLGEQVKENTKTASYLGVILLGVGVTGVLFYSVFSELFSSKSPNSVYAKAAKKCINDPQIEDKLGYPITSYGEETRRGRRQHVSHAVYQDREGKQHLRMKFHLKGSAHSGTVHLDMVEDEFGSYEYRFLFVQVDDMFKSVIVLEDNRDKQGPKLLDSSLDLQFQ